MENREPPVAYRPTEEELDNEPGGKHGLFIEAGMLDIIEIEGVTDVVLIQFNLPHYDSEWTEANIYRIGTILQDCVPPADEEEFDNDNLTC